ncbi:MAG: PAS-domain containing protein, partial [Pseudolabrys sp.]
LAVPGSERRDEVGAMARAVEVFRANAIAHRLGALALRRTNLLFDAALNSMQQGLIVWSPDDLVQLSNRRYFEIFGIPQGSIGNGMTVREAVEISISHGNHPGQEPSDVCDKVTSPPRH